MAKGNLKTSYVADPTREGSFMDKALSASGVLSTGLPHATDLENAVIGGILIDKDAFALVDFLKEKDFYVEKNRLVYNAVVELHAKGTPIDMVTVVNQLRNDDVLGKKIEALDVVKMSNEVVSHANIVHHARILQDFRLRRETITNAQRIFQDALNNKTNIYELRDKALISFRTTPHVDLFIAKTATQSIEDARKKDPRKAFAGAFIKEKEIVFLFGDNGSGKSIFSVQLAQAIAAGNDVFPFVKNEVGPTKVLYYDFEVDDIGFAQRYSNSDEGIDPTSDDYRYFQFSDNFIRITLDEEYIDFEEDAESEIHAKIERDIVTHEAKVIIVDNVSYLSNADLQESKPATAFMKKLLRMKNKYGVTILCIAHNTKIQKGMPIEKEHMGGSKQLSNLADGIITIGKSSREPLLRYVKVVKRRNGQNPYDAENIILTSLQKQGEFLKHHFENMEEEAHHLITIDKTDIDSIRQSVIDEWKETGASPRKLKKRLNIEQSHPTIRKWIAEYKAEQERNDIADKEEDDDEEARFDQKYFNSLNNNRPKANEPVPF